MRRHLAYFRYVLRHKWFVFIYCLKLKVPILSAIIHDWDKFLPSEWFPYSSTFYQPNGKPQYVESEAFAKAWNQHQKINKHHWQYWLLTWDRGETIVLKIPERHPREMLSDWCGAGRAIKGKDANVWKWYDENKAKIKLHPNIRTPLLKLLETLK